MTSWIHAKTLILNSGYEPVSMVSWQRAICLVLSDRAEVIVEYDQVIHSVSRSFPMPSVIRLQEYVYSLRQHSFLRCSRRNVLLRDNFQCQYCGVRGRSAEMSIDHVEPKSRGGRMTWDNVVTACHDCNRRKGARSLRAVGMTLLRSPTRPSWLDLIDGLDDATRLCWLPFLRRAG